MKIPGISTIKSLWQPIEAAFEITGEILTIEIKLRSGRKVQWRGV